MKNFRESAKFKILVSIFAVLIGFTIAAVYNKGSASALSNVLSLATAPIQSWSSSVSASINGWFQKFTDYEALYDENQRLHTEVREMREHLTDYNTIKYENEQFNKIIGSVKQNEGLMLQPATVIARDTQNRFYSFTIDKGTLDGISYLDPVMSADGLVGHVSEVGINYAKVITLLDVNIDIGVYDSEERDIGVLNGSILLAEEGNCVMKYLPRGSKVKEGDMILTSGSLTGGQSIYPRDIYVGEVLRVELDEHQTSLQAIVKPAADVSTVKDVFVITDFKGKGQR